MRLLTNRSELFGMLDVPRAEQAGVSDSGLILLAYGKWGRECPRYLAGDFAFAIWDDSRKELFCARDHVGQTNLLLFLQFAGFCLLYADEADFCPAANRYEA